MAGIVTIWCAFYSEGKRMKAYFKTHSFSEFISEISRNVNPIMTKIVNSSIYNLLSFIACMTAFTGIMYKFFFYDDFMARTTLYIVFLFMIAYTFFSLVLKGIVIEKKRTKNFVKAGMWGLIFLIHLVEFVGN